MGNSSGISITSGVVDESASFPYGEYTATPTPGVNFFAPNSTARGSTNTAPPWAARLIAEDGIVTAGDGDDSVGGEAHIVGGAGANTSGAHAYSYGGAALVYSGNGGNTTGDYAGSVGGYSNFYGGNAGSTTGGYASTYGAGIAVRGGNGGDVSGTGSDSTGGRMIFQAGDGHNATNGLSKGGNIIIRSGTARNAPKIRGGSIYFQCPSSNNGATYTYGGDLIGYSGTIHGASASDKAGSVRILAGSATVHGKGGNFTIGPGTGIDGNGNIIITNLPNSDPGVSGALYYDPVTNAVLRSV